MAVDFSRDIKTAERQINTYVRKGQRIPRDVLDHYTKLLTGKAGGPTSFGNSGTNGNANVSGDLSSSFSSASNSSTVLLSADSNREYVLIQNTGDETVYINFNNPAAVNGGLKLGPDASWSSQIPQFAEAEIQVITVSGSSNLAIYTIGA